MLLTKITNTEDENFNSYIYIYIYIHILKRQHEKYGLNLRKILLTPKFVTYWKKR